MTNIVSIKQLTVSTNKKNQAPTELIHAIDLRFTKGKITGVVGESGSGKSLTMKAIMNILPESLVADMASFRFNDEPVDFHKRLPASMIFQDPMTALNPLRTIGYHLVEVIQRFQKVPKKQALKLAEAELEKVGITYPAKRLKQYPHELSGGMRQRVMIAMALLAKPELLIADEPTTALDVTIQAQILALIKDIQAQENLSMILVSHDFGIIAGMCEEIKVMYQGEIVEEGLTTEVFNNPQHLYTKELLKAIPNGNKSDKLYAIDHQALQQRMNQPHHFESISATHRYLALNPEVAYD
ncbi:ABC transporter ATP-binding protein [Vagococcus zengguangii]|uniref:ABC transporter ATP-binding protein n=1 Tax=Vagococcus zengguangii TaxID=2571750 RepID=A0A4D7D074_9ENTE|nr:ABC transporter ATP-binding protein [Vagococcus zengguangii]QCI87146.1 ABC transporter ATP-binding protein [Vagococcus zengguangii]TLG80650.1 ABC transporter ATP-binding protein [Vagococcus zengguangii]